MISSPSSDNVSQYFECCIRALSVSTVWCSGWDEMQPGYPSPGSRTNARLGSKGLTEIGSLVPSIYNFTLGMCLIYPCRVE